MQAAGSLVLLHFPRGVQKGVAELSAQVSHRAAGERGRVAMMRPGAALARVYVCLDPVDFRKQINGLAAIVQDVLRLDPFSEQLFVFTNRRRDRVKVLYWEVSGFVLWMKRLERERFHWPRGDGATPVSGVPSRAIDVSVRSAASSVPSRSSLGPSRPAW